MRADHGMAESLQPVKAGPSPNGHTLFVHCGHVCALGRPLYECVCPVLAFVHQLRGGSLCVIEENIRPVRVSGHKLIPSSSVHTPLVQVFLRTDKALDYRLS